MSLNGIRNLIGGDLPDIDHAFVLFLFGQQAAAEITLHHFDLLLRIVENAGSFRRNGHSQRDAGAHSKLKAHGLDLVSHLCGGIASA